MGLLNETFFDSAGRSVETVQDVVAGGTAPDQNVTAYTAYTADGQVASRTSVNAATGNQTTTYVYGSDLGSQSSGENFTPLIHDNGLLRAVIYPDSANTPQDVAAGSAGNGGYDRVEYRYDRQGERVQTTDQNQTVHEYVFDQLGRQVEDDATVAAGSGIDGTVAKVLYGYEVRGMLNQVTSKKADNTVVDEVFRRYGAWGQMSQEYQNPAGAVLDGNGDVIAGTPSVGYQYDDGAASTSEALPDASTQPAAVPYLRLSDMIYPNGRDVGYVYSTGSQGAIDNAMNVVSAISDGASGNANSPQFATYGYLGTSTIVGESRPEVSAAGSGLNLTVTLDQFGRVQDQRWAADSGTVRDEYQYSYDSDGNVLWKQNVGPGATGLDEAYTYNGMNELASVARGTLNGSHQITSQTFSQTWDGSNGAQLDSLGNFTSFADNGSMQQRTVNPANEIQSVTGSGATTPTYDKAGNLTSDGRLNYVYDAWNRQVAVIMGSGQSVQTVATYVFDGLGRRVSKTLPGQSPTYYYYSQQDQVLEEDHAVVGQTNPSVTQYVWGLSYIDTPVVRLQDAAGSGVFTPLYYTTDANHNVTALVDGTGSVVERYVYTPYGQVTFCQPDWTQTTATSSTYGNEILYCGYRFDPETAIFATTSTSVYANYQVRAREYSSLFSTFTSRDPIAADVNLDRYCVNNPVIHVDPSGMADSLNLNEPVDVGNGRFQIVIRPNEKNNGVTAIIGFTPGDKCPDCKSIRLVQISKGFDWKNKHYLTPKDRLPFETKPEPESGPDKGTKIAGGWSVDRLPEVVRKEGKKGTICYGGAEKSSSWGAGSKGKTGVERASIIDHPADPNPGANADYNFVTAAYCEDTGQFLGFLRWGYYIKDGKLTGLMKPEGNDTPTPAFDKAIELFKNYFNLK